MSTTEVFLLAMLLIFVVPFAIWRLGRTEYYAPLVVVQILCGILLDKHVITAETFTALLLMAVCSTMLTTPMVTPMLKRHAGMRDKAG